MAVSWLINDINGGDPNYLLTGIILQVVKHRVKCPCFFVRVLSKVSWVEDFFVVNVNDVNVF